MLRRIGRDRTFMTRDKFLRLLIVSGITVVLDQLSKFIIVTRLEFGDNITVIPGLFNITHALNPGGAFGIFAQNSQWVRVLMLLVVSIIAVGFIIYLYFGVPETHPMLANALALILGGAIGNLIDRVRRGVVVDFLDCYVNQHHWPAFNVADSAICIGVGIFIAHIVLNKMPEQKSGL